MTDHRTTGTDRVAAWMTRRLGSMVTVYLTVSLSAVWMVLGARNVLGFDPYPYPVLLFVGNVVQLLLIFVILVGQRTLSEAGERRAQQTYDDAQAILGECHRLQTLIDDRARLLNRGAPSGDELDPCDTAPIMISPPLSVEPATSTRNRRIAAWLVQRLGTASAIVVTAVVVAGWMVLALLGVIPDPYPFSFLLFCSSLAQLVFMFVIMVGQDVIGEVSDRRVVETANHTAVVLQQCRHLRQHLLAQDELLAAVVEQAVRAEERGPAGAGAPAPRAYTDRSSDVGSGSR
ncbi:DUF1003 domain-containing protein [Actinomycetospora sp. TBRC 11914]|uniref:DUF1003 domain-containing protein n=1 Tax=Actinomycetospora sp. TBRC 11914 TaxID=2729387 RepID=UPI00145CCBB5|nr:DUF1003 domain-containing protein [Actinomycetospora sp. TBRC 11914]NMO91038.1 DUF1003 domain-containing protein [Actinomycetospora sp. TBRC 11914]